MSRIVGYARVSTLEQNLDLQQDALAKEGCDAIFTDRISGTTQERPGLAKALAALESGDVLVVWRLDRLGRSLGHLIEVVKGLAERKVGFRSIQESMDTTTPGGKLLFHVFGALAEFERDLLRERTKAGLDAARARGRKGGRRPKMDEEKRRMLRAMYDNGTPPKEICQVLRISNSSLYRHLGLGGSA